MKKHRASKLLAIFLLLTFWGLVAVTSGSQTDIYAGYEDSYISAAARDVQEEETVEQKITANLMVEDMAETIAFYKDALGFELAMSNPERPPFGWAMMQLDGAGIMFQTRESLGGELNSFKDMRIGGSFTIFLIVDDVEAVHNRVHGKAEILKPPYDTFYGMREIAIKDNNGYILIIAQPIE